MLVGQFNDAIVLDVQLPGRNGFDVCRRIRRDGQTVPVLMLTARLELEAVEGYLSVIPKFGDVAYSHVAGRIAADETMHWTVLAQALGLALPEAALSFGA